MNINLTIPTNPYYLIPLAYIFVGCLVLRVTSWLHPGWTLDNDKGECPRVILLVLWPFVFVGMTILYVEKILRKVVG